MNTFSINILVQYSKGGYTISNEGAGSYMASLVEIIYPLFLIFRYQRVLTGSLSKWRHMCGSCWKLPL